MPRKGKAHTLPRTDFQVEAERRLEMLLKRSAENNGIGYLARLAQNICENSDAWYWQGVCDGLNYTAPEFIIVCKNRVVSMKGEQ